VKTIAFLIISLSSAIAFAQYSARELFDDCTAKETNKCKEKVLSGGFSETEAVYQFSLCLGPAYIRAAHCQGFVDGLINGAVISMSLYNIPEHNRVFCLPESGIPIEVAIIVVVNYLKKNLQDRTLNARVATFKALRIQFPCNIPGYRNN